MKILLVKLSSLGDVVHALPVVHDIRAALPGAQIDWVVEKPFAPVLAPCAGLRRVIGCEMRRWRKSPLSAVTRQEWSAFKAQLRDQAYDAVIDLQGLAKSALVARLARMAPGGKRYALANQTDGSGYEAPSRWVADVAIHMTPRIHAVQRSRELAARALGYTLQTAPDFGLKVPLAQSKLAHDAMESIANRVVLAHGTSRADKEWPLAHWVALAKRLLANGQRVALPHGNAKELATSHAIAQALNGADDVNDANHADHTNPVGAAPDSAAALVLPALALNDIVAGLARSAGVVGVDSGVSHIAVALDVPHVQIYNFDTAWRTGPPATGGAALPGSAPAAARQVSVFAQPTPSVDAVWQAWLACFAAAR